MHLHQPFQLVRRCRGRRLVRVRARVRVWVWVWVLVLIRVRVRGRSGGRLEDGDDEGGQRVGLVTRCEAHLVRVRGRGGV